MRQKIYRALDLADTLGARAGLLKPASWTDVSSGKCRRLYAGRLSRHEPQFRTHLGITPFAPSTRNIPHDLTEPFPISDETVEVFQSSDVFEHIQYDKIPGILDEIYRVLVPGGLFRLSVPDYRSEVYLARSLRDQNNELIFDPGGGGRLVDGHVVDGGHVWFPVFENVRNLMEGSKFGRGGQIEYLHYHKADGSPVVKQIDYSKGHVLRTPDHDGRVRASGSPLSIVVDATKNVCI